MLTLSSMNNCEHEWERYTFFDSIFSLHCLELTFNAYLHMILDRNNNRTLVTAMDHGFSCYCISGTQGSPLTPY